MIVRAGYGAPEEFRSDQVVEGNVLGAKNSLETC